MKQDNTTPIPEYLIWWNGLTIVQKRYKLQKYIPEFGENKITKEEHVTDEMKIKMYKAENPSQKQEGIICPHCGGPKKIGSGLCPVCGKFPSNVTKDRQEGDNVEGFTGGEWIAGEVDTYGEFDIVARPIPADGGDIICCAPQGWEDSMKRWTANKKRIVTCVNGWDKLEHDFAVTMEEAYQKNIKCKELTKQNDSLVGVLIDILGHITDGDGGIYSRLEDGGLDDEQMNNLSISIQKAQEAIKNIDKP